MITVMRVRLELILAMVFAVAAVASAIWPTWIESLTGLEPDSGSGEAEWWIVIALGAAALIAAALARRDYRAIRLSRGSVTE
jgi:hypothetical protein